MSTSQRVKGEFGPPTQPDHLPRPSRNGRPPTRFYNDFHTSIVALLRLCGVDDVKALDVAQEFVVETLLGSLRTYDPRKGPFRPFLWKAVRSHLYKTLAKERAQKRPGAHAHCPVDDINDQALFTKSAEEIFFRAHEAQVLRNLVVRFMRQRTGGKHARLQRSLLELLLAGDSINYLALADEFKTTPQNVSTVKSRLLIQLSEFVERIKRRQDRDDTGPMRQA